MRTVYLVRHGHRALAGERVYIGQTDLPLSEEGRLQADALGRRLKEQGFTGCSGNPAACSANSSANIGKLRNNENNESDTDAGGGEITVRLYASPLVRCVETAEILRKHLGGEVSLADGFREIDLGAWEGCAIPEIRTREPEAFEARGRDLWNYRTPGGESFHEAGTRFVAALRDILAETEGSLLIVCHAGVIRAAQAILRSEKIVCDSEREAQEKLFFAEWMKARKPDYAEVVMMAFEDVQPFMHIPAFL